MAKQKVKYVCSSCGYESLKWIGKCPSCDNWNTFTEEVSEEQNSRRVKLSKKSNIKVTKLSEIPVEKKSRYYTNINEFDRVLGGGIMPGSIVLIGGDPGIGKSTLVMQAAAKLKEEVLYVTGEESLNQINLRAKRLNVNSENFNVLAETDLSIILSAIDSANPKVVIIDSIQTIYRPDFENAPGTVTQIRESTTELMRTAKKENFAVIIIGHVTKDGMIAGPKVLEHIVDTVLQFEGERNHSYRILRAQKNRFGSTNEIGIFEMHETGLVEVKNPSEIFLSERDENTSGSVVTTSMEGSRPVLLEVQALLTPNSFGNPQRVSTGFDNRRLSILLAVLEKRARLRVSANNVFLNIAGGLKITEPSVDLAICCAIASSLYDKPVKEDFVFIGEVGLGGEIRGVSHLDKRINEAEKLGFKNIVIPKAGLKSLNKSNKLNILPTEKLSHVLEMIF